MIIRKIHQKDDAIMASIIRKSLEEFNAAKPGTVYTDPTTDHLSELFKKKNSAYFVIEENSEVAGGGGFYPTEGLPANTCELVKMYIDKASRGKHWGQKLLQHCMSEARAAGFEYMYIESMPELKNALSMYEKNGFYYLQQSLGNSGHTGCDLWMMKDL